MLLSALTPVPVDVVEDLSGADVSSGTGVTLKIPLLCVLVVVLVDVVVLVVVVGGGISAHSAPAGRAISNVRRDISSQRSYSGVPARTSSTGRSRRNVVLSSAETEAAAVASSRAATRQANW